MLEVEHRWRLLDHDDLEEFITQPDIDLSIINAEKTGDNKKSLITNDGVPKLSQALAVWNAQMKPEPQTLIETETAMRRFIDIFGDMKISDVHKEHTRKYRDMLSKVPKHLTAKQRMLPINVLMDLDQSHPRPAPQTINKSLNLLGAVLSRAEKEGHFDNINWSNPFAVKLPVDERDEESYEPFSVDELNALLSSPVFSQKIRPNSGKLDTAKWVPLFALFHGARRAEVLQLFVSDVQYIENTGIWTFDINRKYGKKVKNATSERIVPIHPKIIELGFPIFYRERLKAVGVEGALWQGFEDREKYKSRSDNWSKWFHSYLDAHVTASKVKRFHSFRATFKRFGRDATSEMSDVIIDRICGHSPRTEGEKYGRQKDGTGRRDGGYTIERLATEIAKLKFEGVDFSKVL
jgi:integrase